MAKAAGGLISKLLDPLLAKRAGVSLSLINAWSEIVGADIGAQSMPVKVRWPARSDDTQSFEPGVLMIAAEGAAALYVQHQTAQIIERVNGFLGYHAVARIKITQKPIEKPRTQKRLRPLTESQKRALNNVAATIDDEALKASLKRFGENVMRDKK
ncbi:MAG: DciA family protein [Ahrensia sp.]|nr:DciA family protein [Ahrensia sp.]